MTFNVRLDHFVPFVNSFPFQIKCHANVGCSQFHLPLSCPLTAALGSGLSQSHGLNSSAMLSPAYLLPSGSFGSVAPVPLYTHWPGTPASVKTSPALGLLGAAGIMPYITPMANPGMQVYPVVMHTAANSACPKTTRTT